MHRPVIPDKYSAARNTSIPCILYSRADFFTRCAPRHISVFWPASRSDTERNRGGSVFWPAPRSVAERNWGGSVFWPAPRSVAERNCGGSENASWYLTVCARVTVNEACVIWVYQVLIDSQPSHTRRFRFFCGFEILVPPPDGKCLHI